MTKAVIGSVQEYKTKPVKVQAIQFTGKNGKDVVEFIKKNNFEAKNGGKYVHLFTDSERLTVRKGDFVAFEESEGLIWFFNPELFKKHHTISKTHAIL